MPLPLNLGRLRTHRSHFKFAGGTRAALRSSVPFDRKNSCGVGLRSWLFWVPTLLILAAVVANKANTHFVGFTEDRLEISADTDLADEVGGANRVKQLCFSALGFTGMVLLVRPGANSVKLSPVLFTLTLLLLLIVAGSVVWSVEPVRSLKRGCIVWFIALAAAGLGRTWSMHDLCLAALMVAITLVGASFALEVAAGTFLRGSAYRFAGLFHPNQQAANTGIMTIASLCLFRETKHHRYLAIAIVGLLMTKFTGSRGCLLGLLFAVGALTWLSSAVQTRIAIMFGGGFLLSLALIFVSILPSAAPGLESILTFGRSDTKSARDVSNGRDEIWKQVIDDIGDRPVLGYGYGAFWTPERVYAYSRILDWAFSSAHNGYLETTLDIGLVGTLVALTVVLLTQLHSWRLYRASLDARQLFLFAIICMGMVSALVDVMFVQPGFAAIMISIGVAIVICNPVTNQQAATTGMTKFSKISSGVSSRGRRSFPSYAGGSA